VISPDQVDRLQDQLDKFATTIIIGCLFFFVGVSMGIFASQEFANGTNFMQHLAGAEQAVGLLLIAFGWVKVGHIKSELDLYAPPQRGVRTSR
jgi:hypothetical protein